MNNIEAIRTFFKRADVCAPNGGREVSLQEIKVLTREDREELGSLAAKELGVAIEAPAVK